MILEFNKEFFFLSNFYKCRVEYNGLVYPSSENAYQASKCKDVNLKPQFTNITARESKNLGRKSKLIENWDNRKYDIMKEIVKQKFKDQTLRRRLANTSPHYLVEGNYWHDNIWGDCNCKRDSCSLIGSNWLGKILMAERDSIVKEFMRK